VTVDGSPTQTGGELTVGDLITGNPATMASCGDHRVRGLAAGWHRVTAKATASLTVDYVSVLPATGIPTPTAATSPTVDSWDSAARSVTFTAAEHERTLETFESFNSGWQASIDGTTLEAIQVDGWRQGWIVPVHVGGTAELSYGPDSIYRLGLIAGLLGVVALIGLAVRRGSARPCESVRPAQLRLTVICASLIASLLVVGLWGAAMVGAVVVFASLLKSRAKRAILSGALVVLAGLIELYSRWPDSRSESGWVTAAQGLLVVAAVVVSCTAGLEPPVALRRARQRDSNDGPCE
jgi:arabinofuranan 3-O-arabinosyltransferase